MPPETPTERGAARPTTTDALLDVVALPAVSTSGPLRGDGGPGAGHRVLGPTTVSMLVLLEIPGAALLAAVFLGQVPPLPAVPAALLLLTGLAMVIRAGSRTSEPSVPVE